jgi:hypothetical protein
MKALGENLPASTDSTGEELAKPLLIVLFPLACAIAAFGQKSIPEGSRVYIAPMGGLETRAALPAELVHRPCTMAYSGSIRRNNERLLSRRQ